MLWLLLREVQWNAPRMVVPATLMIVVAAVVAADLIRTDAGLAAATLMGVALGNQAHLLDARHRIDISLTLEFEETLVQLLIGVLFVLVAASVSVDDVRSVLPEALVLVVVMVVLIRPAVVALATLRTGFTWRERGFVAWMAPRGIVAGATASAFGPALAQKGLAGAVLYGLTAPLAARLLGVAGKGQGLVLVVSGHPWAREVAATLSRAGVPVRMWVGPSDHREAARDAGIDADRGRFMVDAISRQEELEEITDALLLTASDDFNAVAGAELRNELGHGHVFRVAPHAEESHLLPPTSEPGIIGDPTLTFGELDRRFSLGAQIVTRGVDEQPSAEGAHDEIPLFRVAANGRLGVAREGRTPDGKLGETLILLASPQR